MSLSKILSTARKLGIPVVITNDRGDSPQVVMPFEDFAAMVTGSSFGHREDRRSEREELEAEIEAVKNRPRIVSETSEDWPEDTVNERQYDLSSDELEELDKIVVEEEKVGDSVEKASTDQTSVSLEDQFYFEPVQDK